MIWIRMQTKLTLCLFSNLLQSHQKTEGWWKIFWRDRKTTKIKWAVEWPLFWPAHPWPQRLALELTGEIQLTRSITQQLVSRWYFFGLSANLVFLPSFVYRVDGQWCCRHLSIRWLAYDFKAGLLKETAKKVHDQFLVCGIGNLWSTWMIPNWLYMSPSDSPDHPGPILYYWKSPEVSYFTNQ